MIHFSHGINNKHFVFKSFMFFSIFFFMSYQPDVMSGTVPKCPTCKGVVKPDIVFFGEELPQNFLKYLKDFPLADLLIIMGTSLEVRIISFRSCNVYVMWLITMWNYTSRWEVSLGGTVLSWTSWNGTRPHRAVSRQAFVFMFDTVLVVWQKSLRRGVSAKNTDV